MTVLEIVRERLIADGYDGLVNLGIDPGCGCLLADLGCCGESCALDCQPGFRGPDPDGEADWMIYLTRDAVEQAKTMVVHDDTEKPDE